MQKNNDDFSVKNFNQILSKKPRYAEQRIAETSGKIVSDILAEPDAKKLAKSISIAITNADPRVSKILKEAFKIALYREFTLDVSMLDSQFVEILIAEFDIFKNLNVEKPSLEIWKYENNKWCYIEPSQLKAWIVSTATKEMQDGISSSKTNSVFQMFPCCLPVKPNRKAGLIAFRNTVLDIKTKKYFEHNASLGIQSIIDADYDPNDKNTYHFDKYINHCANGSIERKRALYASIYYVIACRYDKKMFVEFTGKADTGKSTLVEFLIAMVGEENTATLNLDTLDGKNNDRHALEPVVNASLITYPETCKLCGEFETLKAMTGGDNVRINPKNKKAYQTKIRATHVVVGNNPLSIPESTGANFSRRLLVYFDNVIDKPDPDLINKLKKESSGIVNLLMREMTEEVFDQTLEDCKYSADKMQIMEETDAIYSWAKNSLIVTKNIDDFVPYGNDYSYKENPAKQINESKTTLYQNYVLFCDYLGIKKIKRRVFPKTVESLFETKVKNAKKHVFKKRFRRGGCDVYGLCGIQIKQDAFHILRYHELNS